MLTPYDVPANKLIEKLAKYLKDNVDKVAPPAWASLAKTGSHVEKQPQNPDWWYVRAASLMRKIYIHGPVGIEKLRAEYGGSSGPGRRPEHAAKAGGSNIRKAMQQLANAELIETAKTRGRVVTKKGRKLLQELADEIGKELIKDVPELDKYQKGE